MRVMEPLPLLSEYKHLSQVGGQFFLGSKIWISPYPLLKLVPSQREKLRDVHVIFGCLYQSRSNDNCLPTPT